MLQSYICSVDLLQAAKLIPQANFRTFLQYLESNGYSQRTIQGYIKAILHFANWKHQQNCSCRNISRQDKVAFLKNHLPNCQCRSVFVKDKKTCSAALTHWLREVCQIDGAIDADPSEQAKLILAFDQWLEEEAGLAPATRLYRCRYAEELLIWIHTVLSIPFEELTIGHLSTYICLRASQVSLATTAAIACSINSFLRFLAAHEQVQFRNKLYAPRPKLAYCPPDIKKSLAVSELKLLLEAIDRDHPVGKRDYAVTRCLIDLGVRTNEVSHITLDDIDWRNQTITIYSGKSHQQHKLPMSKALQLALSDYLSNGRPQTQSRHVFVYHRAPLGKPIMATTVREIVRRAFNRAGFEPSNSQVHRLRHTMATQLVLNGVPLKTIADILGHQSIDTTVRYTHINQAALQSIALPWPKGADS